MSHLALAIAAVVAGGVNSVAGGGSLLTFPTLIWLGVPPVAASATNTVGVWTGSLGGVIGFRHDLGERRLLLLLAVPSLAGGVAGAALLVRTPSRLFESLAPVFVLGATLLFAFQERVWGLLGRSRSGTAPERAVGAGGAAAGAVVFQLVVAVYGGFLGIGIGIMMLGALAVLGVSDIHRMNGLKNLLTMVINAAAAGYLLVDGPVYLADAGLMAAGALVGALVGSGLAHRLGRAVIRRVVVVIGVLAASSLLVRLIA